MAAPIHTFRTRHYTDALADLQRLLPDSDLVEGRTAFRSSREWWARWPGILASVQRVVFVADPEGTIGAGVFRELLDARFAGLPVDYLTDSGKLIAVERVVFAYVEGGDPAHFARVLARSTRKWNEA